MATYSSVGPSTISMLARPRIDRDRACSGVSPTSMVKATSGGTESAATFGELGAVEITICSPVQKEPIGITGLRNLALLIGAELDAEMQRGRAIDAGHAPDDEPYMQLRDTRKVDTAKDSDL